MKRLLCLIITLSTLVGCAPPRQVPALPESDLASLKLAESADTVSRSIVELARIQAEATPPVKGSKLPDPYSYGMREVASLDWSGPIGQVVKQIAHSTHYRLRVLGHAPSVPIIVTIAAKNVPLGTLLRDVAFQAGKRAKVKVYPRTKVIELRYAHV